MFSVPVLIVGALYLQSLNSVIAWNTQNFVCAPFLETIGLFNQVCPGLKTERSIGAIKRISEAAAEIEVSDFMAIDGKVASDRPNILGLFGGEKNRGAALYP